MRIQRLVIAGFLALVMGASAGLLKDQVQSILAVDPTDGLTPGQFVDESADRPSRVDEAFKDREIKCLTEIAFREAQNKPIGIRRLIALVVIARRDDTDSQWPRTICGIMRQPGQISGMDTEMQLNKVQLLVLEQTQQMAAELYDEVWKTQLMPKGWECVRYWRLSDSQLASLTDRHFAQLGISRSMKGLAFFDKLVLVDGPSKDISFARDPNRCWKKHPTT